MTEWTDKLRRLRRLSAWQWRVFMTTPFVLTEIWLRLRFQGYRAVLIRTRPKHLFPLDEEKQRALARDTAYAMAVALKYGPWRPRCLLRSLALARLLAVKGISSEVRIGLPEGQSPPSGRGHGDFSAHAWVECGGTVLNDRGDIAAQHMVFD